MSQELIKKIEQKKAEITVVGLGRVGLVTAVMFAYSGFQVLGVDIKPRILRIVSSGKSPFREAGIEQLIKKVVDNERLKVTADAPLAAQNADVGVICVQTPLTNDKEPNLLYIKRACEDLAGGLSKDKLAVVESTVPPGTTKEFVAQILEEKSGLKCGKDFWLAHCPERIAPGKVAEDLLNTPRIVGGYDSKSTQIAAKLYRMVTKEKILTTDCTTAEVAKVAENTFRDVNIAFANELALICEQIGVDAMEVIRLANTHPRVNVHKPGCGVGGPCITKDPYLLLHSVREKDFKSKLIAPSRELNDSMPQHTVKLLAKALKKTGKDVENSKVAVLGVAYKGEVDDASNSPAEPIISKLIALGAKVVVYDPHCSKSFGAKKVKNVAEAVQGADCIVVVTAHKSFEELELERIQPLMKEKPIIIDGRRLVDPAKARKQGFMYLGIGSKA